jgi:hypothetical protein
LSQLSTFEMSLPHLPDSAGIGVHRFVSQF